MAERKKVVPVLARQSHGFVWEDDGYPHHPMSYRIWIDDPTAETCRLRVTHWTRSGRDRMVELNAVGTTPDQLKRALKEIMKIHAAPETDPDWLYVLFSETSLRNGIKIVIDGEQRPLIPEIDNSEIEEMVDSIAFMPAREAAKRKRARTIGFAFLSLLTVCLLCGKFAKIFIYS